MRGNYLRAWIIHAGMKNQDLAEALGMSTMALSRRINGRAEWTWKEVQEAGRLLNIPMEEWAQVFQTQTESVA